ncbi:uncharacterized protein V6R79_022555 [Siganus canaliculatus]
MITLLLLCTSQSFSKDDVDLVNTSPTLDFVQIDTDMYKIVIVSKLCIQGKGRLLSNILTSTIEYCMIKCDQRNENTEYPHVFFTTVSNAVFQLTMSQTNKHLSDFDWIGSVNRLID